MATKEQKAMAIKRLNEIGALGSGYLARAKELINEPNLVNQDGFGICGMASSTYVLLNYDPLRFVDLLRSVFNNEEFEGINVGIKDTTRQIGDLLEHRLEQYQRKLKAGKDLDRKAELDFLVCRSLGKLLKKADVQLYLEAKDLSKKFAPVIGVNEADILKKGDLALTGDAVAFILRDIIKVPVLESHGPAELTTETAIINTINNWIDTHQGRSPLIVAAVNKGCYQGQHPKTHKAVTFQNFDWISEGVPPNLPMARRDPTLPDYDHWVVFTGRATTKATRGGQEYTIPLWTWAKDYKTKLMQNLTQGYISWLICAALDPTKTAMPLIVKSSSPDWIADQTTHTCSRTGCGTALSKGHRHHCRLCGKLFCDICCPELDMVPGRPATILGSGQKFSPIAGPVRICSDCFYKHTGFNWMRDNEVKACPLCNKEFGAFRWKHHCRYCGIVVCDDCSSRKKACKPMGYITPVRICKTCFPKVK